ncbi:8-oxoguanine deaminase [Acidihalobacter ferrooxydans]|uniref:8-oxoguanine deaminase n=2 Tax=Acidihalobacter ferrooxydans TaxID=1765967 RepID=A0A1P8UDG4_9GAMM|nr:8-oxoguanine deaminase [Acidihalobacter ferrooxydans]
MTVMRMWIRAPLAILAEEAEGGVVVEGARIVECVARGAQPAAPVDEVFDASGHVVLPGLINLHHHFFQTLTRACPPALDKPLFPWLEALYPVWAGLRPVDLALAARVALVELLRSGCTMVSDHHYLFPAGLEEAIDIEVAALRELGMRAVLTRGSMSLSVEDGGLPPKCVVQNEDAIMADSERLLTRYHERGEGAMLGIALAPCSPFSVTPALMRESAALARREGARLHTHLAETGDETAWCLEHTGQRPVDYLEALDWLGDDVWVAHGIHFDAHEIVRLGQAGVGVCHCPGSNMILASGHCRSLELEEAGSPVGLGVDGSASNDASNLIGEARQALLLQRLYYGADRVGHRDALRWATEGGARCLGRSDIGRIAPGLQADLALFKLEEPRFAGAGDPLAALLLCGAQQADRVMIAGRWRLLDGEVPGLDLDALLDAQRRAARELLRRAGLAA